MVAVKRSWPSLVSVGAVVVHGVDEALKAGMLIVKAFGRSEPVKEFHNSELLRLVHGGADAPDAAVAIVGVSLLVVNELVHRDIHVVLAALAVLRGIQKPFCQLYQKR